jgi:hypothetical protein
VLDCVFELLNQNHRQLIEPYQVLDELDQKQDHDIYEKEYIQYDEDMPIKNEFK